MNVPAGFRAIRNRLDEPFEMFFDHATYAFKAGEERWLPEEVARFLEANSIIKLGMLPNEVGMLPATRALVCDDHPDFKKDLKGVDRTELWDRTEEDSYGTSRVEMDGKKTKATLIKVGGGAGLQK